MADALVIQLPEPGQRPAQRLTPIPDLPFTQGRVDKLERMRTGGRWGDVGAATVSAVMNRAAAGDISDWADLCDHALGTDADLGSLYDTRISRVSQADFIVSPNSFGNPNMAQLAAEFVNECMGRIENWAQAQRDLFDAIAVGVSAGENEWLHDAVNKTNYVRAIEWRHTHRFRYDESWQLRLYDQGHKQGPGSRYGEALIPHKWTIHQYRLRASYPGVGGLMRNTIFAWLFGRWVDKFWIGDAERNGSPLTYARVPRNTPESVRAKILADLERLANDHVGVIEEGGELIVEAAAAAAKSYEGYKDYLAYKSSLLAKLWLGASDIAEPGVNGSQAAVGTRAAVTSDPRMVADGDLFSSSLQATLFKSYIHLNPHKFGCPVEQVPIPQMKLKSSQDEVGTDAGDLRTERGLERQGYTQEVGGPGIDTRVAAPAPEPGGLPIALPSAQTRPAAPQHPIAITMSHGDMLEIVKASTAGDITHAAAFEMIVAGGIDQERARRIVGLSSTGDPDPKAQAPASPPGPTAKSRATSTRSVSPFAQTLRRASAKSVSSSSRQQQKLPLP